MPTISESISYVRSDVCAKRYAGRFNAARTRREALAPYATIVLLMGSLGGRRNRDYEWTEPVARALLDEYGIGQDPLWPSLLLVLCKPMLVRLREEICGDALSSDELDQLVMASFLEAVATVASSETRDGQRFARLHTLTRRGVMRAVTAAQREREQAELVEPDVLREILDGERATPSAATEASRARDEAEIAREQAAQVAALVKYGRGLLSRDVLEMVAHTSIRGGRLIDFVEAAHPAANEEERRRIYEREKRRHARAIALLRDVLEPLRHKRWRRELEDQTDTASKKEGERR